MTLIPDVPELIYRCVQCGQQHRFPHHVAGQQVKCSACLHVGVVEADEPLPPPVIVHAAPSSYSHIATYVQSVSLVFALGGTAALFAGLALRFDSLLNLLSLFTIFAAGCAWGFAHKEKFSVAIASGILAAFMLLTIVDGLSRRLTRADADEYDLRSLTIGMIIGKDRDDELYDIAFPGDVTPNVDDIVAQGKSAHISYVIRIAEDQPIMMIKLVHFSMGAPLHVQQVSVTSGSESAVCMISPDMVSRQSVSGGIIEFATLLPYNDPIAGRLHSVICNSPACNIEVKGAAGYTTMSPGKKSRDNAAQMVALFEVLRQRPDFIQTLKRNSLSAADFQRAMVDPQ